MAEKSDLIKTEFLNQMSHEIRTPINVILSSVNLIGEVVHGKIEKEFWPRYGCGKCQTNVPCEESIPE